MNARVRLNLLSVTMKLSLMLGAISLLALALDAAAFAATPVDVYQDMENGNVGDTLTPAIMNGSSHGGGGGWSANGSLWVATAHTANLPAPVFAGGVTYNGAGSTRTWKQNDTNLGNWVGYNLPSNYSSITLACHYTPGPTTQGWVNYDQFELWGYPDWGVLQTRPQAGGVILLYAHGALGANMHSGGNSVSTTGITIASGKTYWINLHYDAFVGTYFGAVWDPANGYAQVGSVVTTPGLIGTNCHGPVNIGRQDSHGNDTSNPTQSYFDNILIDYSNGAFPLIPNNTDSTAPGAPPVVRDGTGADQSIALSTTQLSANWDPAWDAESGISGYQYAIGTSAGGTQTVNWTTIKNVLGITKTGLTLTTGQTYFFSVRAVNGVGLTGNATNSNGQTVGADMTAPGAPAAVRDGGMYGTLGLDADFTTSTNTLIANFDPAVDPESGISCYQYAIGTTPGGTQTVNWTTDLAANAYLMYVSETGFTMTPGTRYYFSIRAINNAGLAGAGTSSDGVVVVNTSDTTAPSAPPAVRDGLGADISTTNSTTQLSANWDRSTDNESGISSYQYAIGTTPGGTNIVNYNIYGSNLNYTGPNMSFTRTGLSLAVGQTYYFSVKAINGVGIAGAATSSNGVTVVSGGDSTPPTAPANVRDGTGADISTTSSTTQLSANWDAATDPDSGISGYQYSIGTSAGGTQTVNWTSLGNVTSVIKGGLTLTLGQTYFFSVKAVNGAGLTGNAANSNGQTVVSVGNAVYFSDNFENWTVHGGAWSSVNGESSTHTSDTSTDYAMAGSKCLKTTDTDTTATTGASLTKNFSPVISGDIYVRFFVFLPTGFGSANATCIRRIVRVYTNTGSYTVITLTGDGLYVQESGGWTGTGTTTISENAWHCVELHVAPPSASTAIQFWVDGTSAGTCTGAFSGASTFNSMMFGDVALATSGTTNDTGTIYWDEVIVANYYIDPSAPSAPANVRDGTGADISTTASTTQLSANWDAATDADSGISGYQYAIGTSVGGTQTTNWTSLGNVTTVTQTGLTLTVGQTYYVSVRAVNGAGLNSAGTTSNGQTVVVAPVTYFSDNFENWAVHGGAWSSISGETSTHTINTSTDYARAGTKSLKITDTDTTATSGACLVKTFSPVITTDIYVRFYIFLPTGFFSTNSGCNRRVLRVWCGTNRSQISFRPGFTVMEEVGAWGYYNGPGLSENAWHCIELHVAPPTASTTLQFWIDGASIGTLTANYSNASNFSYMELGDVSLGSGNNGTGTFYLDEAIVSNSYNGPLP